MSVDLKALERQFDQLQKGELPKVFPPLSTGWDGFNAILGGGYAGGRIVELRGGPSSGKTSVSLCAAYEAQKNNGLVGFIDASHSFDRNYAQKLGCELDEILVHSPKYGEEALEMANILAEGPDVSLIILDSIAGIVPIAELLGNISDVRVGHTARLLAQAIRTLAIQCAKSGTTVLLLNEEKSGRGATTSMHENLFRTFCAQRIELEQVKVVKNRHKTVGNTIRAKVVRNLLAPPDVSCDIDLLYAEYQ